MVSTVILAVLLLDAGQSGGAVGALRAVSDRVAACKATGSAAGPELRVHGRLFAANGGGSGYRIWPVGTKRLYSISPRIEPAVPEAMISAFKPFAEELYGDFRLVPLAVERAGRMREMCLVAGENLVVRNAKSGGARRLR